MPNQAVLTPIAFVVLALLAAFVNCGEANDQASAPIKLVVYVPAPEARLAIDGHPTKQTGATRWFISPAVSTDQPHSYAFKATWMENGSHHSLEKQFMVWAGTLENTIDLRVEPVPRPTSPPPSRRGPEIIDLHGAAPTLTITAPLDASRESSRLITVTGRASGVPKGTQIILYVETDLPYLQDNVGVVGEDGAWSSPGVVLGAREANYVHRIYAVTRIGGREYTSRTIRVTRD